MSPHKTGDGMALVFRNSPEEPVRCALEISRKVQKGIGSKEKPQLKLRMGVHSGPVSEVVDLNERTNVAGSIRAVSNASTISRLVPL